MDVVEKGKEKKFCVDCSTLESDSKFANFVTQEKENKNYSTI